MMKVTFCAQNFGTRLFRTVSHHLVQERESKCFVCFLVWVLLVGVGLVWLSRLSVVDHRFPTCDALCKPNLTVKSVFTRHCFLQWGGSEAMASGHDLTIPQVALNNAKISMHNLVWFRMTYWYA